MWSERISYTEPFCPYIMKTKNFFKIGKFNEKTYYHEDVEFRLRLEKLKIPYLISKTIHYYTDMGSHFSDFKRQANNTAKSFMTRPFRSIEIFIQILLSFLTFPIFYLSFFSIMMWRTGDIYVSIFSPFLWIIRRILEFYYLLKLAIK